MTRRTLAAALAVTALGLALVGCSSDGGAQGGEAKPPATTSTTIALRPPERWTPSANEVEPALKSAAADTVTALLTYDTGGGTVEAARRRLAATPADPSVADKVAPLLIVDKPSAADVVYPQMGGYTGTRASVMTVTRIRVLDGNEVRSELRTLDVRLALSNEKWHVVDIASLGGSPVAVPDTISPAADAVLRHPRIELPDSAKWDIAAGTISDVVLETLRALAEDHDLRVGVLSSGHPLEVFGTSHPSNHIPGRAVDIWSVDGMVVERRAEDGPLQDVVRWLLDRGVTELGAPFDLDGPGGANFANLVHQDHLHIGYDRA